MKFTSGDEGVDEFDDDVAVALAEAFDLAEAAEEVPVGELCAGVVGVAVGEEVDGGLEGVGEAGEGLGGGAGLSLLVAADL